MSVLGWLFFALSAAFIWYAHRVRGVAVESGVEQPRLPQPQSLILKILVGVTAITMIAAFAITSWAQAIGSTVPDPSTGHVQAWIYRRHTYYLTVGDDRLRHIVMVVFVLTWAVTAVAGIIELIARRFRRNKAY